MKIPKALLHRINLLLIVTLEDILILERKIKEILLKCQSVIDVLWCLEFVINVKNVDLYSKWRNKIFVNDHQLKRDEFVIAQRKDGEYKTEMSKSPEESRNNSSTDKIVGSWSYNKFSIITRCLASTVEATVPARLQRRFLQQEQIKALRFRNSYQSRVTLSPEVLDELGWWINKITVPSSRSLIQPASRWAPRQMFPKQGGKLFPTV